MCGIAGIYTRSRELLDDRSILDRMQRAISHRGPDDAGVDILREDGLGLVNTRLSVIDLTYAGHQPMWNADRTIGIVYNGEIYNFQALRRQLEASGSVFRSHTDTEVILRAYEAWGIDAVERLNGMFAFAIWDGRHKRLWLVRDRMGKKPLYYWHDPHRGTLLFASEIKALLAWPCVKRQVSPEGLNSYLSLGYVPFPHTMFEGIAKLPPGHWLQFDGARLQTRRYWDVPAIGTWNASEREYRDAVRSSVEGAVARRLVSDVPLGAFLSGGIDSSIVVGVMSRLMKEPVHTFSAAFAVGPRSFKYNVDADFAEKVSKAFGTNHTRLTVRLEDGLLDSLKAVVWSMDEPNSNPTMLTTYLLARLVKEKGVTVVLSGDGSDEIFGGYLRYQHDRYASWARRVPLPLRRALIAVARRSRRANRAAGALSKAELTAGDSNWYLRWHEHFGHAERMAMLSSPWSEAVDSPGKAVQSVIDRASGSGQQDLLSYVDLALWIAEESNMRMDKMTMAHGLESRAPFLDFSLVSQAMSIPFGKKVGVRRGKRLLSESFADLLPREVIKRPKWGWLSPRFYWIKDLLWEDAKCLLSWLPETGIFRPNVTDLLNTYPPTRPQEIWALMVFALWYQAYLENE